MKNNSYIWLLGENLSKTHNNNSYCFWRQVVETNDNIEKYFILEKNKENIRFKRSLKRHLQKYIVWRNSIQHFELYFKADMYFVTLSYRDVRPEQVINKKFIFLTRKPVIYLQHGTLAMKQVGYTYNTYNNNLCRFIYYNKAIKENLIYINKFKDYQLYYGEYLPRYQELVKRNEKNNKSSSRQQQILWFITWREYFGDNIPTKVFLRKIEEIVCNEQLMEYLKNENTTLKIALHAFFKKELIKEVINKTKDFNIEFIYQADINLMDEIARSNLLITDYSSVGFDFSFLKKPVILYQPDLKIYLSKRNLYCSVDELKDYSINNEEELIKCIINKEYSLNEFFMSRLPTNINYKYVKEGKHIDKMYKYFANLQKNKITFLGYNFFGIGGTVTATVALAEALLEKDYLVELISLKRTKKTIAFPAALSINGLYGLKSRRDKIAMKFIKSQRYFGYLKYDKNINLLKPIAGYRINKLMNNIKSKIVISTRESMHLALKHATSQHIKKKIYFYHCDVELLEDVFPQLIDELKKEILENVVFVTEENKKKFENKYDYHQYNNHIILGNTLESFKMINKESIRTVSKINISKETEQLIKTNRKYIGIYLLRVNDDRIDDINNLISFGKYLVNNKIEDIRIDVYGKGNYVKELIEIIIKEKLENVICYRGYTGNIRSALKKSDCLVDFSLRNSFGMSYIEAIFNGKPVFCIKNTGSTEVMKEIPNVYIKSHKDLVKKIHNLPNITIEQLYQNYDKIYSKYSREVIGNKFLRYIGE